MSFSPLQTPSKKTCLRLTGLHSKRLFCSFFYQRKWNSCIVGVVPRYRDPTQRGLYSGTNVCTGDFAPLEPEFGGEFCEARIFGSNFLIHLFPAKRGPPPPKIHPPEVHLPKIQPRNRAQKFRLHLCREERAQKVFLCMQSLHSVARTPASVAATAPCSTTPFQRQTPGS